MLIYRHGISVAVESIVLILVIMALQPFFVMYLVDLRNICDNFRPLLVFDENMAFRLCFGLNIEILQFKIMILNKYAEHKFKQTKRLRNKKK